MKFYLIVSDSKTLLDEKIKEIVKDSTNCVTYPYKDSSITDILEEASYVSLFEEEKFVIVKNADFFGKGKLSEKENEALTSYILNPYPCTTIIFTTYEEIDKTKSLTKLVIENATVFILKSLKNKELFQEIKKKMSIYKIEDQTIRYMIESCINNYDFLINEINKLSLIYKKGDTITLKELKKIIVPNVNDNVFKFVDAVVNKDIYMAFHLLEDFMSIKVDVMQLMNLLAREYRLIYYYKILANKNYNLQQMAKELKLQEWQVEKIRKESSLYHQDDIQSFLISLSYVDLNIKSGVWDKVSSFQKFLLEALEY